VHEDTGKFITQRQVWPPTPWPFMSRAAMQLRVKPACMPASTLHLCQGTTPVACLTALQICGRVCISTAVLFSPQLEQEPKLALVKVELPQQALDAAFGDPLPRGLAMRVSTAKSSDILEVIL